MQPYAVCIMEPSCADEQVPVAMPLAPGKCSKCKEKTGQFCIRSDLLCADCLLQATEHRFKSTLRTQIGFERAERLLVAVSGGPNSMALGQMIVHALDPQRNQRRMNFLPHIPHIDDSALWPEVNASQRLVAISAFNLPLTVLNLEEISPREVAEVRNCHDPVRADYLFYTVRRAIVEFAWREGFSKVLLGDSGSRVAGKLLAWICKGRGAALWQESCYSVPMGGVVLCRPLKDILDKEIALYIHLNHTPVHPSLPLAKQYDLPGLGSIDVLTQGFLSTLQEKFPATTHTVLRTAGKLVDTLGLSVCPVCMGPKDAAVSELEGSRDPESCYACSEMLSKVKQAVQ